MKQVKLWSVALALPLSAAVASGQGSMVGVPNPAQAHIDYLLKCQGCHRPEGGGDAKTTPVMAGKVSHFLRVPGGRAFLARVPGVATVDLNDARLAQLINWTLYRFDAGGLPQDFRPYTATEIGQLRKDPLRTNASFVRQGLIAKIMAAQPNQQKI